MKYRLVIFDSDGTLADTLPWMRSIFNELALEYGFRRVDQQDQQRLRNLEGRALLRELGLPLWKVPKVVGAMRRRMALSNTELRPFPGIPEMLQRLAQSGQILAVVSSNSAANVQRILGAESVRLIAHFLCGASMFGKAVKLRRVLRLTSVPPEAALYIGDEIRDGQAAGDAGITFGAVSWGQHDEPTLRSQSPAEFFHSVDDIAVKLGA
jgi:phosphoglycolate phosphatase